MQYHQCLARDAQLTISGPYQVRFGILESFGGQDGGYHQDAKPEGSKAFPQLHSFKSFTELIYMDGKH